MPPRPGRHPELPVPVSQSACPYAEPGVPRRRGEAFPAPSCCLVLVASRGEERNQRLSLSVLGLSRLALTKWFTVAGTSRAAAPSHKAAAWSYTPGATRWISLDSLGRRTAKPARISISVRTSGLGSNCGSRTVPAPATEDCRRGSPGLP